MQQDVTQTRADVGEPESAKGDTQMRTTEQLEIKEREQGLLSNKAELLRRGIEGVAKLYTIYSGSVSKKDLDTMFLYIMDCVDKLKEINKEL